MRELCIFARQNLAKDPPFSKLDLIVCRNVLIYLAPILQQKLMRLFHYGLKPSGHLVLGISETVGAANDLFQPIDRKQKVYARQSVMAPANLELDVYRDSREEHAPRVPAEGRWPPGCKERSTSSF